jgi:hypothetical protein
VQLVFILERVLNGPLVGAYYLLIALGLSLELALGGIVITRSVLISAYSYHIALISRSERCSGCDI